MHIPQGMAYSLLASLPPVYGLYTSFYPVLIYWLFGTSRHISIGTFAVISLMVADTMATLEPKYVPPEGFNMTMYQENMLNNLTSQVDPTYFLSMNRERARILIVMANAFWIGIIQIVMFFFQLGFITSYLSEPFVNSFLAGSAVHVFTSQMKFQVIVTDPLQTRQSIKDHLFATLFTWFKMEQIEFAEHRKQIEAHKLVHRVDTDECWIVVDGSLHIDKLFIQCNFFIDVLIVFTDGGSPS